MKKILVLHGPNLNLLGTRETAVYGTTTLDDINQSLVKEASSLGFVLSYLQSNSETVLIEAVHKAGIDKIDWVIINPAAYTHTSIALRDAFAAVAIPFIEVHLSNVYAREPFRHRSYFSDLAKGVISGFGSQSYSLALQAIVKEYKSER